MAALTYTVLLRGKSGAEDPVTTTPVSKQRVSDTQPEDPSPAGGETKLVSDDAPASLLTASLRETPPDVYRGLCFCEHRRITVTLTASPLQQQLAESSRRPGGQLLC